LETGSNQRDDEYGGSVENRSRFGLRVVEAVQAAIGQAKTAIRLSPYTHFQGMRMAMPDIKETYSYFVTELKYRFPDMAYLHLVESRIAGSVTVEADEAETVDFLYDIWTPKPLLVAGGFKQEDAAREAAARQNTVVVFGRYFLSTPDLVERIRQNIPFNPYNRETFYLKGDEPRGYIDYPFATEICTSG
jgi:NADPH2 dehydrogenase